MTTPRLPHPYATPDRVAPEDWRASAACAGDEDLFDRAMPYQPYGAPRDALAEADALAICAACPVRAQCAAALLPADDGWHVRAGTTPRQRRNSREDPA